ncbi:MAG: hypothetical protein M1269_07250 [Chloroflexi bacterium]|nr:hypothetical protein [Chloroflexota bacterium]
MNLSEIRTKIYTMLQESGSNSIFSNTTIDDFINSRYFRICRARPWNFLLGEKNIPVVVTTVSSESTGTTLHVDSVSGMSAGRKLIVTDGNNFEQVTISEISGETVTLEGTGLSGTYNEGDKAALDNYFMPQDCWKIISAKDPSSGSRPGVISAEQAEAKGIGRNSLGNISKIITGGINTTKEPLSGLYAMGAGSDGETVVCGSLSGNTYDYYAGWMLMNTERNNSTRIISYTSSSKTLKIEKNISTQTEGDSFYITPRFQEFYFDAIPDPGTVVQLAYRMIPAALNNDEDVPVLPEAYHILLVYGVMVDLSAADRNNIRAGNSTTLFHNLENELFLQMADEYSAASEAEMLSMDTMPEPRD